MSERACHPNGLPAVIVHYLENAPLGSGFQGERYQWRSLTTLAFLLSVSPLFAPKRIALLEPFKTGQFWTKQLRRSEKA